MPLEELAIYVVTILGAIIACSLIIYAMGKSGKEKKAITAKEEAQMEFKLTPFKVVKSVLPEEASRAKEELRTLELEREILSDAIRRLYEAHAEGKISERERERLAQTYKARMMVVKEAIAKDESLVALHELEAMQEDLIKLFSERFDELNLKIEELRSKVEAKPIKEITIPPARTAPKPEEKAEEEPAVEEKEKRKKKTAATAKASPKTEVEKRIEEIRAEVEKVLERLEQMEIET